MQDNEKKPALRFKGFTDPWEQRKLGDITVELSEYATQELGLPLLTSSRSGLMYQDEYRDSRTTKSTETLFSVVPVGTCTYRHMSDDDVFHMNINTLEKGLVSREYPVFEASKGNNLEFLVQHINSSEEFKAFCAEQKKGGTRTRLYYNTLCQFTVRVPALKEQAQISQCLKKLDTLITLHQRKYEKLVNIKKSMLDKMFPQNGASVPEIRFKGFTDPWEQRKASEVFQIVDDRGHPTLPVLSATQNQGMIYRDDSGRYIGHDESNEIGYKRVLPGDFVVHLRSFQGGFAHSQYEGITSPAYTVFRAKEPTSHSDRFWKHWFMSEHFIAGLSTVTYGIRDGRSISVDEFMNTFLAFPAVEEQAAISRLFDYLDDLITLHQRKRLWFAK